eukprot:s88_g12.t1
MASLRIFRVISLLGLAGARRAPEGGEAALGCLAGIYPKEAWPQLRSYADAAALLEKSCRSLGHDSETCGDTARAVFARFGTRMSAPVTADEQLCSDVLAAFTTIISTASTLPPEVVEKLQEAQDPQMQRFLDRSKRCTQGNCEFGSDDESDAPPKEALEWCPELLQWLHREKHYGPEGYHVICLDPSEKGSKRSAWLFANASTAAGTREIVALRPWASFRKSFQPWLRPSSRWELHPWQLFDTDGHPEIDRYLVLGVFWRELVKRKALKWNTCKLKRSVIVNLAMTLHVSACLMSGRTADLELPPDASVAELRRRAQEALGVYLTSVVSSAGVILQDQVVVAEAVKDGESVTVHTRAKSIAAASIARFTAICGDGSVESYTQPGSGVEAWGSCQGLTNVRCVQASHSAFAAILGDGSVKVWGWVSEVAHGGETQRQLQQVKEQLQNVVQIQANCRAFAAIKSDGSVVTWGEGGTQLRHDLAEVSQIQANHTAFAAIKKDGSVVTWGDGENGGDSHMVQQKLFRVRQIQATFHAFAALREDGHVVSWGDLADDSMVQDQLTDVRQIQASSDAFAALKGDGTVVAWGGEDIEDAWDEVQDELTQVRQIQATANAFAAIREDGSVVTWGDDDFGGDSSHVQARLKNVQCIQAAVGESFEGGEGAGAFAALLKDGSVVTWGCDVCGGDSSKVQDQLVRVEHIQATLCAFAALREDGAVVTWGHRDYGGDSSRVQERLRHVKHIQASETAFAAILDDETVVTWGSDNVLEDLGEEEEEDIMLEESPEEELLDDDEDWQEEGEEDQEGEEEEEGQEEEEEVQTAEAASRSSLLLLFEGGEFQYPAVHLGFRRSVALGAGVPAAELRTLSLRPVVFSVEGFADGSERRALKKLAKPLLKKSEVRQFDNHPADGDQSFRSSWSAFLPAEDPLVSLIMNRSQLLTKVAGRVENLQVMRYRPGQQYQAHWDFFDPENQGFDVIWANGVNETGLPFDLLVRPAGGRQPWPPALAALSQHKGVQGKAHSAALTRSPEVAVVEVKASLAAARGDVFDISASQMSMAQRLGSRYWLALVRKLAEGAGRLQVEGAPPAASLPLFKDRHWHVSFDATETVFGLLIFNGLFDNVLSQFAWAKAVQWTSPTAATVGLSLTIPLSVVADFVRQKQLTGWTFLAAALVITGFICVTVASKPKEEASGASGDEELQASS